MRKSVLFAVSALLAAVSFAAATVKDVKVTQCWPWSGRVCIDYTLDAPAGAVCDIDIELKDGNQPIPCGWGEFKRTLYGVTAGTYRISWDPALAATGLKPLWPDFTATVRVTSDDDTWMIVDISGGAGVESFPVSFTGTPPSGGWNQDEYKTTKMVFRKIPAGTFTMGSPKDEISHSDRTETLHEVTFTNDFYIGVFELTKSQYSNIVWTAEQQTPGYAVKSSAVYLNYGGLRGVNSRGKANFPAYDEDSFFGRFNKKFDFSGTLGDYVFDVPTISQWEYACRAGTTGAWNNGTTITNATKDANLALLARYRGNGWFAVDTVGNFLPNGFGLYDMHGNAGEICLDVVPDGSVVWWNGSALVEPILYDPDHWPWNAVLRGGNEEENAGNCRSASNNSGSSSGIGQTGHRGVGVRLALVRRRK